MEISLDLDKLPEATDRRVATTVAFLAVNQAITNNISHNATTNATQAQARATVAWAEYQAHAVQETLFAAEAEAIRAVPFAKNEKGTRAVAIRNFGTNESKHREEKLHAKTTAESEERACVRFQRINDRCDVGCIFLQIGIILASIGVLVRWKYFWYAAMCFSVLGAGATLSVYLI